MITISYIQTHLYWENKEENFKNFEHKIAQLPPTDLIILPETFNTGFSNNFDLAEPPRSFTYDWMKKIAQKYDCAIMGSYVVFEKGKFYNRLIFISKEAYFEYDKRHLFTLGNEKGFEKGTNKSIIRYKNWTICPMICYDLRFPVWSRNQNLEYDILLYCANFPAARQYVWNTLLHARAIENQAYTIGVNCIGKDGNGIKYSGGSSVIDFKGQSLYESKAKEDSPTITLSSERLEKFRQKFPVHLMADRFCLIPDK